MPCLTKERTKKPKAKPMLHQKEKDRKWQWWIATDRAKEKDIFSILLCSIGTRVYVGAGK